MKSTPGSERATPLHGQVKFVPSMRNWFSLVPEPNADTVVVVPLAGEVGEIPGAALIKSNMLDRRVGIVLRSSGPKQSRIRGPGPRSASPPLDRHRFGDARHLQHRRSLDGRARATRMSSS